MRIVLHTPRWGFEESAAQDGYESPFREDMPDVIVVETRTTCEGRDGNPPNILPKDSMVWMDTEVSFMDVHGQSLFRREFSHKLCLNFLWDELTSYEDQVASGKDNETAHFSPTEPYGRMESTASGDVACVVWAFDAHHYLAESSSFGLSGFYIGGLMDRKQYHDFVAALQKEAEHAWRLLEALPGRDQLGWEYRIGTESFFPHRLIAPKGWTPPEDSPFALTTERQEAKWSNLRLLGLCRYLSRRRNIAELQRLWKRGFLSPERLTAHSDEISLLNVASVNAPEAAQWLKAHGAIWSHPFPAHAIYFGKGNRFILDEVLASNDEEQLGMALTLALRKKDLRLVGQLLDAGARCSVHEIHFPWKETSDEKLSASLDLLDELLARGSDIDERDMSGETLLMKSMNLAWPLTVELVKRGANVSLEDNKGRTSLHHAAIADEGKGAVGFLRRAGANLEAKDKEGHTPLMLAFFTKNFHKATRLILEGADIEATDDERRPVLYYAVCAGTSSTQLTELGFDLRSTDAEGRNLLFWAAGSTDCPRRFDELCKLTPDLPLVTKNGYTVLMEAARQGREASMLKHLARLCDVNARDQYGMTALAWTVFSSHCPENVGELIALKASADTRTNNGLSLADLARTRTIFREAMLEVLPLHIRRLPPVIAEDGPLSTNLE